ncbi:ABC transporter ATP-binding protein [Paenibacillus wynnii]|uniref:ABC transporter ATP-binding protein n=1 Tax=Paenibacillus wynnii TaxID=268407 RepID=UPI0027929B9C|nr:ABC transporter ATP-binding protein [Paenibacillus wynnii]MDQ0194681.1 ABC-type multidrug transport system fused ATPase/permease subunit [Paenibacillus wynnii]
MRILSRITAGFGKSLPGIQESRRSFGRLFPYLWHYRRAYSALFMTLLFNVGMTLFSAWMLKHLTDAALNRDTDLIKRILLLGIAVSLLHIVLQYVQVLLQNRTVNRIALDLRNDVFAKLMEVKFNFFGTMHTGELVSRVTRDVQQTCGAAGSYLLHLLIMPISIAATFVYLLYIDWRLSLVCLLLAPAAGLAGGVFSLKVRQNNKPLGELYGRMHAFLQDALSGYTVIRSIGLERHMKGKLHNYGEQIIGYEDREARLQGGLYAGSALIGTSSFLVCIGAGSFLVANGSLTVGSLLAFVSLMQVLVSPFSGLASQLGGLQRSLIAADRLWTLMDQPMDEPLLAGNDKSAPASLSNASETVSIRRHTGMIEFDNVSFSYHDGDDNVLRDISFSVPSGHTVALVGPSGAGKTTLFHLTHGFQQPKSGRIFIQGRDLTLMERPEAQTLFAYVPQETHLFEGTIRDNIALGSLNASYADIVAAAESANADPFITSLPKGYDTDVGENGSSLSGGQRQRIAIARAILKDSPILLLDEATSSLDSEAEFLIRGALRRLMEGRTTLVIAHRLSTIRHADTILVLNQGQIVEQGRHDELLRRNGLYARMYRLQSDDLQLAEGSLIPF